MRHLLWRHPSTWHIISPKTCGKQLQMPGMATTSYLCTSPITTTFIAPFGLWQYTRVSQGFLSSRDGYNQCFDIRSWFDLVNQLADCTQLRDIKEPLKPFLGLHNWRRPFYYLKMPSVAPSVWVWRSLTCTDAPAFAQTDPHMA